MNCFGVSTADAIHAAQFLFWWCLFASLMRFSVASKALRRVVSNAWRQEKNSIHLEPELLEYLCAKAAEESRSISDVIHEAVNLLVSEDAEDIADFDVRIGEPNVGYDAFVQSLKADGIT